MAQQNGCSQTLLLLPKVAYTSASSVHLRPELAHIHAASTSIAPGTQKLTHSPGRQSNTHGTNS